MLTRIELSMAFTIAAALSLSMTFVAHAQQLSYQQCLDLGTAIARLDGEIEALKRQVADGGPKARLERLEAELETAMEKKRDAERWQRTACAGVTVKEGPVGPLGGSGETLPGGAAPSIGDSAKCGEIKPVLDRLRNELPDVQRRVSNIQAQLNSRIAPPAPADRPALEAELKRLTGDEDYSLTQIAILKERLMGLGCDPNTGNADPKVPALLKDIERAPDSTPSTTSTPGAGGVASLCSRLPDELRQAFVQIPGPANPRKCELVEPQERSGGRPIAVVIFDESSDEAARGMLRQFKTQPKPIDIGDEGYSESPRVYFARGRFVVHLATSREPTSERATLDAKRLDTARRIDGIVSRW